MRAITACSLAALALGQSARDDFDCPMRLFMLQYAAELQPFRSPSVFQDIADALNGTPEKTAGCDVTSAARTLGLGTPGASRFVYEPVRTHDPRTGEALSVVYVDGTNGNDANNGTYSFPVRTLSAALTITRASPGSDSIVLRAGTYYQLATTVLTQADSGLTIQAFPGEEVWLSGATPLTGVTWTPFNVSPSNNTWQVLQNANAVYAAVPSPGVVLNGTYPSWEPCQAACQANYASGGPCKAWTWHDANTGGYALQCYFRIDGVWQPVGEADHVSGHLTTGPNIWKASLAGTGIMDVPGLRWNGKRLIRARYPNSDPEFGFGASFNAGWTAQQTPRVPDIEVDLAEPVRNTSVSMFQTFTAGVGGTCDRFQPDAGYWCSTKVQGGGSVIYFVPIAMNVTQIQLPNTPYKNATGAVIQTWRPGHWASWMFEVGSSTYDASTGSTNFTFSRGGFQGSRGSDTGAETYIENVFEELDAAGEFYYDPINQTLYLNHNVSNYTAPPTDGSIVVTQVRHLFNITGDSPSTPVQDVSVIGVGIRDTAYTYLDPHGIPSGGDWTLERSASVYLENTERVAVSGCVFERVDGNGVVIAGYNRNATVKYNEFVWLGGSAVASWGDTEGGNDSLPYGFGLYGTNGTQPRGNMIVYNLMHELGIWEKQSSGYTQFKSGRNFIAYNIMYNGPRAMINFNDGFMGGSRVYKNMLANTCRESADHGPFNSWDRDVYLWDALDGSTTYVKDMDEIAGNAMLGNYNTLCCIDNDDGSSYYNTHNNFFVYGGCVQKNDFEGHDNWSWMNVGAFVGMGSDNGYGGTIGTPGQGMLDGHEDKFFNNTVILNSDGNYALPICSGRGATQLADNTVYTPTGNVSECGMSLAAWQAAGNDLGTSAAPYPGTQAILDAAAAAIAAV